MRSVDQVVVAALRDLIREQRQVPSTLVGHVVDLLEDAVLRARDSSAVGVADPTDAQLVLAFDDAPVMGAACGGRAARCC